MKRLIIVSIGTLLTVNSNNCFSQSQIDLYAKNFDAHNTSCEMLSVVNTQLNQADHFTYTEFLKKVQKSYPLESRNDVDSYINEFNINLKKTKQQYESQEFLWKTGKEIGKYGLSVLGNYASALPSKYLTNFLTPAIQQGYELYIDSQINDGIDQHKQDIDKIIIDRINLLYSDGVDVTKITDESRFNALFDFAHADFPEIGREEYGAFNKELTKRAYDFIKQNRDEIKLLNLKTTNQYNDILKQLTQQVGTVQKQVTEDVNLKLKELGNSVVELASNQAQIFQTLEGVQKHIKENEVRIAKLENDMLGVIADVDALKIMQREHSRLIAQNSFQIDILSGYAFQNLNTVQKLNGLRKGHFDNIFNKDEKEQQIQILEEIRTKETIISVSSDIENYSKGIYGGLVNTGIIKGKDAEVVGKFISGISVLSGAARVYAGDPSGFTSIISGLGGLFGKPQVSPELQMMRQMYEVMNERFNNIDKHLEIIDKKLDNLSAMTFDMYKTMLLSFQYTGTQIDKVSRKTNYLHNQSSYLIFKDYNNCKDQNTIWKKNNNQILTYSDIKQSYNPICELCLQGLNSFLSGEAIQPPFYLSSNPNYKNVDVIDEEINEIFTPTTKLFLSFYKGFEKPATYALMFPFDLTTDSNKPLIYIKEIKDLKDVNYNNMFEHYYNYELINEVVDNLLTYSIFFETQGNTSQYTPQEFNEYLKNSKTNKNNQSLQEQRLLKMLDIIQSSITQQSLLSGNLLLEPIYSTLFGYSTNNEEVNLSVKVLNNDKLLATNFAINVLNKNLNFSDIPSLQQKFSGVLDGSINCEELNSLMNLNDFKFKINDQDKRLYLTFSRKGNKLEILCPDFQTILDNKMIYTDAIYSLLESRQKVNEKLVDLTFSRNFDKPDELNKFKFTYGLSIKLLEISFK